jgi:hypothetical protein
VRRAEARWNCPRPIKAVNLLPEKLKFEDLVYLETPSEVWAEVRQIVLSMFPHFDFNQVQEVFKDVVRLFDGKYPGYRQCNTMYHDLNHTTDCLLVLTRLMHGALVSGIPFQEKDVTLGLISAFMHDTGYLQTAEDRTGTGAKYTLIHIDRSIGFMKKYFKDRGYPQEDFQACRNFLKCTGLDVRIGEIDFPTREQEIIGKMLGTADLIGQMSDKNYLEKLPFLYHEFKEGGVPGFEDELDLFQKTPYFWEVVKTRFAKELGGVDGYLREHFRVHWGIDQDFYRQAINRNIESLQIFLENYAGDLPAYPVQEDICWV